MTHMKRYSICSMTHFVCFRRKNLICQKISWTFGNFNDQNNINLSKNVSFEVSCNWNEWYDMYHIAKALIYRDTIQSPSEWMYAAGKFTSKTPQSKNKPTAHIWSYLKYCNISSCAFPFLCNRTFILDDSWMGQRQSSWIPSKLSLPDQSFIKMDQLM